MYNNYFIKDGQEEVDLTIEDSSYTSFTTETYLECTIAGFLDSDN